MIFETTFALRQDRNGRWHDTPAEADGEREAGREAQAMAERTGYPVYAVAVDGPSVDFVIRCAPKEAPERVPRSSLTPGGFLR